MVTHSNGTWSVPLPASHAPYRFVQLKRRFPTLAEYRVVVVDVAAFMNCYSRDQPGYVIPTVENWPDDKSCGLRKFLDPNDAGIPEMAVVSFELATRKRWLGLFGEVTEGVISFINGRHRSRYLQFAGAKCFPVETHASSADGLLKYCGCACCN